MAELGPQPVPDERELDSMSFLEHLEELRRRVIWSVIWIAAGFGICFYFADYIYGYMQRPIIEALKRHNLEQTLVFTNPTDVFNAFLKIGLIAGIFLASPFVLYQVWLFISPGLYRHEKRYVLLFMFSTVGLFLAGGLFAYTMAYPAALDFLIGYSQQPGVQFKPMITITEYTDLFMTIIVGLGLIFELPIIVFFLSLMGLI